MPTNVSLHPLPEAGGSSSSSPALSLLHGYYGLEECCVRGVVRISHQPGGRGSGRPLRIKSLSVVLKGKASCMYVDPKDAIDLSTREDVLLYRTVDLLTEAEAVPCNTVVQIPFEIPFPPDPDPDSLPPPPPGTSPSPHLLPPSMTFFGRQAASVNTYQGRITYEVTATLIEVPTSILGMIPLSPATHVVTNSLSPFTVYDPRLLPTLLHPDIRRWRSAPGAIPVEYDIEVGSMAMGPGDTLRFAYRIVVASDSVRKGVRIKKVALALREHHMVGEQTCQGRVDDPYDPVERTGTKVKGYTELLRWEQAEESAPVNDDAFELSNMSSSFSSHRRGHIRGRPATAEKSPLPRPGFICRGGDGLYAESEMLLKIPPAGSFAPTTAKIAQPPPVPYNYGADLPALVEVRHTLQVTIEFTGADKLVMESGCVLASVGREDCGRMLDRDPEIAPPLDYDKIVGGADVWVPEYAERDELADALRDLDEDALAAIRAVLAAEAEEATSADALPAVPPKQPSGHDAGERAPHADFAPSVPGDGEFLPVAAAAEPAPSISSASESPGDNRAATPPLEDNIIYPGSPSRSSSQRSTTSPHSPASPSLSDNSSCSHLSSPSTATQSPPGSPPKSSSLTHESGENITDFTRHC
ncbi:hypothetical protein HDU89_000170 [Geranomyces variabilis]|nr:hypothetical protein HDU89_000170 [Geranomyces variabilis]